MNGYAIAQQIERDSEYLLVPSHQSVYQALTILEKKYFIEPTSCKKYIQYQLTARGHNHLKTTRRGLQLTLRHLQNRS